MNTNILYSLYNKIKYINPFMQQVSFITGCTIVAQLLNIFILPLLSRIYSPSDFGVLAVYSSGIAIIAEISGLRYYLAIPLPKQQRYVNALVALSFMLQIVVVIFMFFAIFLFGNTILKKISMDELIPYQYLLPCGIFIIGVYNILSQVAIRQSLFMSLGYTKITQCISGAAVKIILGIIGMRPTGLLCGAIIGQGGGCSALLLGINRHDRLKLPSFSDIRRVLLRYRKFPIYGTGFGLLNTFGTNLPSLFLSTYFGMSITGLYSMAISLLHIPSMFIGQALGQVFLQSASVAKRSGNLQHVAYVTYIVLWKIGCFPILFISVFAPYVFSYILGARWAGASQFTILLAPWIIVSFVFSPMSMLYAVQERQEKALLTEVIYFFTRLLSIYIGITLNSSFIAILLFSFSGFVLLCYRLIDILRTTEVNTYSILIPPLKELLISIALIVIPVIVERISGSALLTILCCIFTGFLYLFSVYQTLRQEKFL